MLQIRHSKQGFTGGFPIANLSSDVGLSTGLKQKTAPGKKCSWLRSVTNSIDIFVSLLGFCSSMYVSEKRSGSSIFFRKSFGFGFGYVLFGHPNPTPIIARVNVVIASLTRRPPPPLPSFGFNAVGGRLPSSLAACVGVIGC